MLDSCSRYIVHSELREPMEKWGVVTIVQCGLEKLPGEKLWLISGNDPQSIARDFKTFVPVKGITHVRANPSCPQSNGKLECWHGSLK